MLKMMKELEATKEVDIYSVLLTIIKNEEK